MVEFFYYISGYLYLLRIISCFDNFCRLDDKYNLEELIISYNSLNSMKTYCLYKYDTNTL